MLSSKEVASDGHSAAVEIKPMKTSLRTEHQKCILMTTLKKRGCSVLRAIQLTINPIVFFSFSLTVDIRVYLQPRPFVSAR